MTVLVETRHPGEFILSEANGQRSREAITIASGAGIIAAGTVLGKVTASGKYVASAVGATRRQRDARRHRHLRRRCHLLPMSPSRPSSATPR